MKIDNIMSNGLQLSPILNCVSTPSSTPIAPPPPPSPFFVKIEKYLLYMTSGAKFSHIVFTSKLLVTSFLKSGYTIQRYCKNQELNSRSSRLWVFLGKVFWKYEANLQENNHVKLWFQQSCIFSEHLFIRTPLDGCFLNFKRLISRSVKQTSSHQW